MCCDEISSCVPRFPLSPIGHVLLYTLHFLKHIQVCLLLHVSCWSSLSIRPIYSLEQLCLFIIPQSLLAKLVESSNFRQKSCSCLLHHVLPVVEPSDVFCGTTHCSIGDFTSRCCQRCCRQVFPEIFKPSLPPALPAFFSFLNINHLPLFRSSQTYLSPLIRRASPALSTSSIRLSLLPFLHPTSVVLCTAHPSSVLELTRCPL